MVILLGLFLDSTVAALRRQAIGENP